MARYIIQLAKVFRTLNPPRINTCFVRPRVCSISVYPCWCGSRWEMHAVMSDKKWSGGRQIDGWGKMKARRGTEAMRGKGRRRRGSGSRTWSGSGRGKGGKRGRGRGIERD